MSAPVTARSWWASPWLWLALLAALAVDLPGLSAGMWVDEWATLTACCSSWSRCMEIAWAEPPPPGYYVLGWLVMRILPEHVASIRIISIVAHLVTLSLLFYYAQRFHGPGPARIAALVTATAPCMVWFATNGRCYAVVGALAMACIVAYRSSRWFIFAITAALLGWTHYFALLLPAFLYLWELGRCRTFRSPATGAGLLAFAFWSPLLWHIVHVTLERPMAFDRMGLGEGLHMAKLWLGLDLLPAAMILVLLPLLATQLVLKGQSVAMEMAVSFLAIALVGVSSQLSFPVFHPKLVQWTMPLVVLSVAVVLESRLLRPLALVWVLVVAAGGVQSAGLEKSGDRTAAMTLARLFSPRDRIILSPAAAEGPLSWYLPRLRRTGTGAPAVWVMDRRQAPGSEDPAKDFIWKRYPAGSNPAVRWNPAQMVVIEPERP
jgi:hypothetical protein